ncbi:MAG: trypsin-like serine protease [Aquabacterium sp.]|jgi:serine protease DegQ|nr:MAG: trypsin-like serine protease [Aquabacterium sp.]
MRQTWLIFAQAVTVTLAAFFVVATLKPQWLSSPLVPSAVRQIDIREAPPAPVVGASGVVHTGYALAAKRAAPAVVSIVTSAAAQQGGQHQGDRWFRFFFGDQAQQPPTGIGSGVIVSDDGYLLTNNHVVDRMDDIQVQLTDGRKARAKLIGSDPDTDLAVLKIDLDKLPVITFGNSDSLAVGDVVLAIGNPFGVGQTVTSGIVSALGRNQLGINTFENFIQTDAAINPGNSGGALVDANGYLMGVNSAIYSRSGGNLGIGFAIPVSTARQVMESLIRDGQVVRGWIGVEPRDLTPEIAETFNLPVQQGVLITGVLQGGPAGRAGIQPGDVVLKVGDRAVQNTAELLTTVAALKPKAEAGIRIARGNRQLDLTVQVGQRPRLQRSQQAQPQRDEE